MAVIRIRASAGKNDPTCDYLLMDCLDFKMFAFKTKVTLLQGRTQGGVGGSNPPIGLSTKMHSKEIITFLALLSLFFCNDKDSNMI